MMPAVLAAVAAMLLAACGGDEGATTDSTADTGVSSKESTEGTEASPETTEEEGATRPEGGSSGEGDSSGEGKGSEEASGEGSEPESGSPERGESGGGESGGGGGSKQKEGRGNQGGSNSTEKPPAETKTGIRGFGSEASGAETEAASVVVQGYVNGVYRHEWSTVCASLSQSVLKTIEKAAAANPEFKGKPCAGIFEAAAKVNSEPKVGAPLNGPIDALRVKGKNGYALYKGEKLAMAVVKEDAGWKINAIEPVTLS